MTKILITGSKGYIGTSVAKWLSRHENAYDVDMISVRDGAWRDLKLGEYDAVLHAAAVVHTRKEKREEFYAINRDLTIELAKKAKLEGVKHYIFLSTMAVYGIEEGHISLGQIPAPKTPYATSKYQAEIELRSIEGDNFAVSIIRPPMIYGPSCPGNYKKLSSIVRCTNIFPDIPNERSMLYIDNLCEFLRIVISEKMGGTLFPQNSQYVSTSELVSLIARASGRSIHLSRPLGRLLSPIVKMPGPLRKAFGSLTYDWSMSSSPMIDGALSPPTYETIPFPDSVTATEIWKFQNA
ncbi:NAD-dependent epimerase/dehydratase family protein [Allosphingosinicella vermicomposti]|uniref:NAD-dependent epimerase/dehydratase family protein n=1 Tax=Allosphingosinicella vermicomposti TaxID=614671 RepID=UPI000D10F0C0|nr:NAD-dependent epimerase/dehydratase family protein [Allosphingosinicella vermicomposti]